mmetsp:Transcript_43311/g.103220  ORF Transcript_43311/g.103220 Transcript_43311/m.103220 type:complete len:246 (-) Transcript_43311:1795-2532(-)
MNLGGTHDGPLELNFQQLPAANPSNSLALRLLQTRPPGSQRSRFLLSLHLVDVLLHKVCPKLHPEERNFRQPLTRGLKITKLSCSFIPKTAMPRFPSQLTKTPSQPPKGHQDQRLLSTASFAARVRPSTWAPQRRAPAPHSRRWVAKQVLTSVRKQSPGTIHIFGLQGPLKRHVIPAPRPGLIGDLVRPQLNEARATAPSRVLQVNVVRDLGMVREDPPLSVSPGQQRTAPKRIVNAPATGPCGR